jgi:hypothetical protein
MHDGLDATSIADGDGSRCTLAVAYRQPTVTYMTTDEEVQRRERLTYHLAG